MSRRNVALLLALSRMCDERTFDVAEPAGVQLVPLHRLAQALLPGRALLPAQRLQLAGVDGVAQVVEVPILDE